MRFFSILPITLLPLLSLAAPNVGLEPEAELLDARTAAPDAQPDPAPFPEVDPLLVELARRQTIDGLNLSGILGTLSGTLQGVEQLLSAQSLNNIESVVTNLADLLASPFVNETRSLINTASNLLGGSLISEVEGLLTPATVKEIGTLLTNANNLLTPTFVSETKELISDVAPLVSAVTQIISVLISSVLGVSTS